jgi:hypothetical protein
MKSEKSRRLQYANMAMCQFQVVGSKQFAGIKDIERQGRCLPVRCTRKLKFL